MRKFSLNFPAGFLAAGVIGLFCLPPASGATSQLFAWGDNSLGQTNVPPDATNVLAIAAGGNHSLALNDDGTVTGWGDNSSGQTNAPADLTNAVAIAAGGFHSLALRTDGTVVAWGAGLTNSGSPPDLGQSLVPPEVTNAVAIAAGQYHSLALRADGTVTAWGDNSSQQTDVPTTLSNVVAIAAGGFHSLALKSNGTVAAWGDNTSQQTNVPAGLNGVMAIAAGGSHSLALKSDGRIVGWGSQTNVPAGLTIPNAAIISTHPGTSETGTNKATAQNGNVAINGDKNGPLIIDGGDGWAILANGRANVDAAYTTVSTNAISMTNWGTASQVFDYTTQDSSNQLYNINRFIAVADLTPNGPSPSKNNHFTNMSSFFTGQKGNNESKPMEGVIVVNISSKDIANGIDSKDFPLGINVRGVLVFNFATNVGPWDKLTNSATMNINAADLSGLVPGNPATYASGYPPVITNSAKNPVNIDITSRGFANFAPGEDLPALMYNISILAILGNANICGIVFSPSFIEIENKADAQVQYFKGTLIGGGGVYVENFHKSKTIISSDSKPVALASRSSHNLVLKADGKVTTWGSQAAVPAGLTGVDAIAAGDSHSLALARDDPPPLPARLTNPTRTTDGFSVVLPTQSGRVYALEYKNSLTDTGWTTASLAAGNGDLKTLTDPTASESQRFYRVRQW